MKDGQQDDEKDSRFRFCRQVVEECGEAAARLEARRGVAAEPALLDAPPRLLPKLSRRSSLRTGLFDPLEVDDVARLHRAHLSTFNHTPI